MDYEFVQAICRQHFPKAPTHIKRFSTGLGNYVFLVKVDTQRYVLRCNEQPYAQTVHWLKILRTLDIPVPHIIAQGVYQQFHYLLLTYIPGTELGEIYPHLTDVDKKHIATEVIQIQKQVANLKPDVNNNWSQWVEDMLQRARIRIIANGYFDVEKVDRVAAAALNLHDYLSSICPTAYLDDITTKNLLIQDGHVSGIIDVDWIEYGDPLTFVALTHVSLLNMNCDTDYVDYLLHGLHITPTQYRAFLFYSLLYCVDFMGERGMTFVGRTVEVDDKIIARLNGIYKSLWQQFYAVTP